MGLLQRQVRVLDRVDWLRFIVVLFARVLDVNFSVKHAYEDICGIKHDQGPAGGPLSRQLSEERRQLFKPDDDSCLNPKYKSRESSLNPRYCLLFFNGLRLVKMLTTFWFFYIATRALTKISVWLTGLDSMLPKPVHCYMVGTYILDESLSEVIGTLYSVLFLVWRYGQRAINELNLSAIKFWSLGETELNAIYSKFGPDQRIEMPAHKFDKLHPRDRHLLKTLCYSRSINSRLVFKLKSNRTRESHGDICHFTALIAVMAFWMFAVGTVILIVVLSLVTFSDFRFLRLYPGCDAYIEKLNQDGKLKSWPLPGFTLPPTLTLQRLHVLTGDGFENFVLWVEAGFVTIGTPCMATVLMRDFYLQWSVLDVKINHLRNVIGAAEYSTNGACRSANQRLTSLDIEIRDLLSEISDYFYHVKEADRLLSAFLSGFVFLVIFLCASYTYFSQVDLINDLSPIFVCGMLELLISTTLCCYGPSMTPRLCHGSYTKLCALMAYDPLKHKHSYGIILDLYVMKKSCFTLLGGVPFTPLTFLAVIGWTVSWSSVIAGLVRHIDYVPKQ